MPRDMFEAHFEKLRDQTAPLAARMRPQTLADYVGQEHLVGEGRALRRAIDAGELPSIILWGPPGSGKTTLAHLMAAANAAYFAQVSAVSAGVADLRKIIEEAKQRRLSQNQKTILFIDEIHRFNKGQQDTILPYVEDGTVTLIGATTENPSFEVISALLSRARVFTLEPLGEDDVREIVSLALSDARGLAGAVTLEPAAADRQLLKAGIGAEDEAPARAGRLQVERRAHQPRVRRPAPRELLGFGLGLGQFRALGPGGGHVTPPRAGATPPFRRIRAYRGIRRHRGLPPDDAGLAGSESASRRPSSTRSGMGRSDRS